MAVKYNYKVQAEVVDLREESPQLQDKFFVDTNALFYYSHPLPKSEQPKIYQIEIYPKYIKKASKANSTLFYCGVNISELAHIIEKTLFDFFVDTRKKDKKYYPSNIKKYRHNYPQERKKVIRRIQSACHNIEKIANLVEVTLNYHTTRSLITQIQDSSIDGYDAYILEAMINSGINQIITDDGDFATVAGIIVFTANDGVITAAKSQGKFITR